jgi:hypothetical protein
MAMWRRYLCALPDDLFVPLEFGGRDSHSNFLGQIKVFHGKLAKIGLTGSTLDGMVCHNVLDLVASFATSDTAPQTSGAYMRAWVGREEPAHANWVLRPLAEAIADNYTKQQFDPARVEMRIATGSCLNVTLEKSCIPLTRHCQSCGSGNAFGSMQYDTKPSKLGEAGIVTLKSYLYHGHGLVLTGQILDFLQGTVSFQGISCL